MLRGSPGPGKRAKRVPPVPTPQVGMATPNAITAPRHRLGVDAAARELARQRVVILGGGAPLRRAHCARQ